MSPKKSNQIKEWATWFVRSLMLVGMGFVFNMTSKMYSEWREVVTFKAIQTGINKGNEERFAEIHSSLQLKADKSELQYYEMKMNK